MIAKRSIIAAIVGFWCVMNFLLVKRQLAAPPSVITLKSTEKLTDKIEEWWGVFYRGEKIGFASQVITPKTKGYKLQDRSRMNLNMSLAIASSRATRSSMGGCVLKRPARLRPLSGLTMNR